MKTRYRFRWTSAASWMPAALLGFLWLSFAIASPQFRRLQTLSQILDHSASTAIVAIGMTFVLLTAGIDLSVGAVMLVAAAVAGKLLVAGGSVPLAVATMLLIGVGWGAINGLLITRLKMMPFVVTLAMLFVGRGIGLWITQTRPVNLPDRFRVLATGSMGPVSAPIILLVLCCLAAHLLLTKTPLGRQIYAVGSSPETARKAGVSVHRVQLIVYVLCGLFTVIGGAITLSQLNAVSPNLGQGRELDAIAAAILGGVSLFGGRGSAPQAAVGAILIQSIFSGLSTLDADPNVNFDIDEYYYPLITGAIIFLAVLMDSLRKSWGDRSHRRLIRPLDIRQAQHDS